MALTDPTSRTLTFIHLALIIALWLIPLASYNSLPERIPVHFNATGEADSWSDKSGFSLWMLPLIWTVMGIGLIFLLRFPKLCNFPRKAEVLSLPVECQQPVHRLTRQLMLAVFVVTGALFVYIEQAVISSARAGASTLNLLGVLIPIVLMMAILIVYLMRIGGVVDKAVNAAKEHLS